MGFLHVTGRGKLPVFEYKELEARPVQKKIGVSASGSYLQKSVTAKAFEKPVAEHALQAVLKNDAAEYLPANNKGDQQVADFSEYKEETEEGFKIRILSVILRARSSAGALKKRMHKTPFMNM